VLKRSRIDNDIEDEGPADPARAVLVLNEDADACELVARLVELAGYPAVRAFDPASLVDQLREGGVAGVVIDSLGTGISAAFEVLDAIRAAEAKVKDTTVIILAATDTNRLYAYQSGVDGYIVRPFHADDLVDLVRNTLGRSLADRVQFRNMQLMGGAATS
jgi:two-component system response regulator CpxR